MLLSRAKPAENPEGESAAQQATLKKKKKRKFPKLEDFLQKRDYIGAATLCEFMESSGKPLEQGTAWQAYCAFHLGDYRKALKLYKKLVTAADDGNDYWVPLACCCFMLGMFTEADAAAMKGPPGALQNRLLFHVSHKVRGPLTEMSATIALFARVRLEAADSSHDTTTCCNPG